MPNKKQTELLLLQRYFIANHRIPVRSNPPPFKGGPPFPIVLSSIIIKARSVNTTVFLLHTWRTLPLPSRWFVRFAPVGGESAVR